ncbi:MAG: sigma-70 family RNA polymerase sigma factor [Bacteroidetes bacterium]|jgi:RNA polymerase sigma factor (sigma-70 family)|nr:sigma-70 family RNA polymerase sigma factor [Bacteroidota bacterium]
MSFSTSSNPLNDTQLWQQLKLGSELALGKLIKKYFNQLQHYAFKFVKDEAFIKDCVQDVFISIWTHRETIIIPQSIHAYLLSSVRRKVLREKVRQRLDQKTGTNPVEKEADLLDFSHEWLLIEQESLNEMTKKVSELLNELPKRQREVLYLKYYQNLERAEIADIMGINEQSVSNHLQAAFKNFKDHWQQIIICISIFLKFSL